MNFSGIERLAFLWDKLRHPSAREYIKIQEQG